MKLIGKIMLILLSLVSIPSVMAIGIVALKATNHALDGSPQFWFITIVTVVCAFSLFMNFLQLIGVKIK